MIVLPNECLRGLDCQPYSQIKSNCGASFICCGLNPQEERTVPQDQFRVCWKNAEIDDMSDWDRRDLIDTISVMAQALSVDANIEASSQQERTPDYLEKCPNCNGPADNGFDRSWPDPNPYYCTKCMETGEY